MAIKQFFLTPFQRFINSESLAGRLLLLATVLALAWANSPWSDLYFDIWQMKFGFHLDHFQVNKPLILWINDGLMAIFFFLIGLELKRELWIGELNSFRKATLPFIAATGGVIFPVLIYLWIIQDPELKHGWAVPMATDIAFALAVVTALGNRVPLNLKIFLTAFAIVDDLAAVLVIALFYSHDIHWLYIAAALLIVLFMALLFHRKGYMPYLGFIMGTAVWFLFLKSGLHPTIAGVLTAFTIPIRRRLDMNVFRRHLENMVTKIKSRPHQAKKLLDPNEIRCLEELDELATNVQSPLQHLENKLHGLVAYFILPVFAFANAGIRFGETGHVNLQLIIAIATGLFIGKSAGILLFSWFGVKLKITALPEGTNFKQITGIAFVAGIGFTMSVFIANLAFEGNKAWIDTAKIGIMTGSLLSGLTGYLLLRISGSKA